MVDLVGLSEKEKERPPFLYSIWHNRIFALAPAWRRVSPIQKTAVLTSASRDGAALAAAMSVFKVGAVRGSTSRRGAKAMAEMLQAINDGVDIGITPDGPRGPVYKLTAGVLKLSQSTGLPVIPVHVHHSSFWEMKTWDQFRIPKPFSKVTIVFGKPITTDKDLSNEEFEEQRVKVEDLLNSEPVYKKDDVYADYRW